MAQAKLTQATWDKIGRQITRDAGGIKNLVHYVVEVKSYDYPNGSLDDWAKLYIRDGAVWVSYDDRANQLDKLKIPYKDADKKFNEVYGRAAAYLVQAYLKTHGLMIERTYPMYNGRRTYKIKVVKDPSVKKTVKKKTVKRK